MTQINRNIIPPPVPGLRAVTPVGPGGSGGTLDPVYQDFLTRLWTMAARAGRYTVTGADVSGGGTSINTGLKQGFAQIVQILRANIVKTEGASVVLGADGMLVVASGSGYTLTAGDVINWVVIGQGTATP